MSDTDRGAAQGRIETLCRASVRVGPVETWYSTWGRGAPVLVFLEESLGWAPADWLATVASPPSRVILPEVPPTVDDAGFSTWLVDFLDGLGIETVRIAAEAGFGPRLRAVPTDHRTRMVGPIRWIFPPYRS